MLYPIKKRLVNWVDGMKISKKHLMQTDDYMIDVVRDTLSIGLTNYNFGMLPPYQGEKLSYDLEIVERITNNVQIELRHCNAITPGGCRINFSPLDSSQYLRLNYQFNYEGDDKNASWDIILIVHPFERKSFGTPDPEETPPRNPDADKGYGLHIKPSGQMSSDDLGAHHLMIGRVKKDGEYYAVDTSYIAPSSSMISHPDLKKYYELFGTYLNDMEISSRKIMEKIQSRDSNSEVAQNIKLVCEQLLIYISTAHFNYRNKGRYYAPIDVVNVFSSLAHVYHSAISFVPKKKREEMLQYFYEWADITPGNFMKILTDLLNNKYDHQDIRNSMVEIDNSLLALTNLWHKLTMLEYIGQHKENIVVAEKIQKVESNRRSEWTILD